MTNGGDSDIDEDEEYNPFAGLSFAEVNPRKYTRRETREEGRRRLNRERSRQRRQRERALRPPPPPPLALPPLDPEDAWKVIAAGSYVDASTPDRRQMQDTMRTARWALCRMGIDPSSVPSWKRAKETIAEAFEGKSPEALTGSELLPVR
jgi:hypothetical protein